MLDDQIPAYTGQRNFEAMILGLLSRADHFVALIDIPRRDGGTNGDGELLDFALGVVAFRRTLRAVLSQGAHLEPVSAPAAAEEDTTGGGWLR